MELRCAYCGDVVDPAKPYWVLERAVECVEHEVRIALGRQLSVISLEIDGCEELSSRRAGEAQTR